MQKSAIFVRKIFETNMWKIKNIEKLEIIIIMRENIEVLHIPCNWKYSVTKKIPIAFHNGSNYDYHFIIKELAEDIKKNFLFSSSTWERSCENW